MADEINTCPVYGGGCPRCNVRPARLTEERVVHCHRCGAELLVQQGAAAPECKCEGKR